MRFIHSVWIVLCVTPVMAQTEPPKSADARLVVELVASSPHIVHPISCDFDHQGRLLVIESHTHFAPKDYKGPKFDRIRAFKPKAQGQPSLGFEAPTTFFEGTRHTMDLAVHPDGSVYIATRNEILRLRESKDGVKKERIVFLDTKGDYPHNGLSGLCFDSKGDLLFGMGENLGAKYMLIGADGVKFSGEGDGGHIFHCTADGKNLRRVATGFWNPFGICRDIYGRTFAVDNDADQMPPCRMLHVVEGGDYGFRFMYGRSGKHPFQSWHGELPGTLPMMTGVGEAPCEILSYESDGLPKEYLGQLLVTSWADHRVERYKVGPHGASFKAERLPFVQGGKDFRPVGLCTAPDGSLYVTDWVKSDYTLHGKGAIWRIRWKDAPKPERPTDPKKALFSDHWPLREAAARKLADDPLSRGLLISRWAGDGRVAAASLAALIDGKDSAPKVGMLEVVVKKSTDPGMQELALRELVRRGPLKEGIISEKSAPILRATALAGTRYDGSYSFTDKDPFLHHASVRHFANSPYVMMTIAPNSWKKADFRLAYFLASDNVNRGLIQELLKDSEDDIRFLAAKRIADRKLVNYREDIEKAMQDPKLSVRMYLACATALARIDGQEVSETKLADVFAKRLADDATPAELRVQLLKQVPATHKALTLDLFRKLIEKRDAALTLEVVRATVEHPGAWHGDELESLFVNPGYPRAAREYATLGLPVDSEKKVSALIDYGKGAFRDDAMRALIGSKLTKKQRGYLEELETTEKSVDGIRRVLGKPFFKDRPPAKDLDAWLKRLEGPADADAGGRIFAHPKLGQCAKCHRIDGRGQDVGPDLSAIGRTDRRHILESILQPSNTVAPHYQTWYLETPDGKVRTGMLVHTQLDEYTYLDPQGGRFKLKTGDLVEQRALTTSIMPDGLVDRMTDQEVRDLLAYLQARK